jgi:hypothetical protein
MLNHHQVELLLVVEELVSEKHLRGLLASVLPGHLDDAANAKKVKKLVFNYSFYTQFTETERWSHHFKIIQIYLVLKTFEIFAQFGNCFLLCFTRISVCK